ncbi:hypothetical protein [Streptomyces niveus]|uniref:hypothetical protein n=1 Tax=Streptomyces niveus TaxID=193462 RepID=UPI0036351153
MTKTVRVAADYDCYPVWIREANGLNNVPPSALPVTGQLQSDLDGWGDEFDATLNRDDPAASGFSSAGAEDSFAERGKGLARRLKRELGTEWQVTYFDLRAALEVDIH